MLIQQFSCSSNFIHLCIHCKIGYLNQKFAQRKVRMDTFVAYFGHMEANWEPSGPQIEILTRILLDTSAPPSFLLSRKGSFG